PLPAAGPGPDRRAGRPPTVHGLGRAAPHRFRRLPGMEPRRAADGGWGGGALPVAPRRRDGAPPDARAGRGGPAHARGRHPPPSRRVPPPSRDPRGDRGGDVAHRPLGPPDPRRPSRGGRRVAGVLRHRPGRDVPGPPPDRGGGDVRARVRRVRPRRLRGRGAARPDAGAGRADRRRPAGRAAAVPDGGGPPQRSGGRGGGRDRPLRLRAPDPARPDGTGVHPGRPRRDPARSPRAGGGTSGPGVRLLHLPALLPGVPPAPLPRPRARSVPAPHPPQPDLLSRPDGRHARCDRGRALRRPPARRARGLRLGRCRAGDRAGRRAVGAGGGVVIDLAYAMGQPPSSGGGSAALFVQLVPIALVLVIFYFLVIRPQQRERRRREEMLAALKKGDRVVTSGGLIGTVVGVSERRVTLKLGDSVRVECLRSAITGLESETKSTDSA